MIVRLCIGPLGSIDLHTANQLPRLPTSETENRKLHVDLMDADVLRLWSKKNTHSPSKRLQTSARFPALAHSKLRSLEVDKTLADHETQPTAAQQTLEHEQEQEKLNNIIQQTRNAWPACRKRYEQETEILRKQVKPWEGWYHFMQDYHCFPLPYPMDQVLDETLREQLRRPELLSSIFSSHSRARTALIQTAEITYGFVAQTVCYSDYHNRSRFADDIQIVRKQLRISLDGIQDLQNL